ncbi:hypothetical protein BESB_073490 [Besnoitia besnoiti]|uniref:Sec7 domain-containing protein n=1 Tax=Besnoitia besnoiti TaxID=94643 RepID=A0A2A9MEY6_BESBE|nr:uncharacterized protein BESB_073490 [Besnoitia besnoiti]PFH34197.1 hypothetical protein BESB_073490 [Besnoitia besnoiti]
MAPYAARFHRRRGSPGRSSVSPGRVAEPLGISQDSLKQTARKTSSILPPLGAKQPALAAASLPPSPSPPAGLASSASPRSFVGGESGGGDGLAGAAGAERDPAFLASAARAGGACGMQRHKRSSTGGSCDENFPEAAEPGVSYLGPWRADQDARVPAGSERAPASVSRGKSDRREVFLTSSDGETDAHADCSRGDGHYGARSRGTAKRQSSVSSFRDLRRAEGGDSAGGRSHAAGTRASRHAEGEQLAASGRQRDSRRSGHSSRQSGACWSSSPLSRLSSVSSAYSVQSVSSRTSARVSAAAPTVRRSYGGSSPPQARLQTASSWRHRSCSSRGGLASSSNERGSERVAASCAGEDGGGRRVHARLPSRLSMWSRQSSSERRSDGAGLAGDEQRRASARRRHSRGLRAAYRSASQDFAGAGAASPRPCEGSSAEARVDWLAGADDLDALVAPARGGWPAEERDGDTERSREDSGGSARGGDGKRERRETQRRRSGACGGESSQDESRRNRAAGAREEAIREAQRARSRERTRSLREVRSLSRQRSSSRPAFSGSVTGPAASEAVSHFRDASAKKRRSSRRESRRSRTPSSRACSSSSFESSPERAKTRARLPRRLRSGGVSGKQAAAAGSLRVGVSRARKREVVGWRSDRRPGPFRSQIVSGRLEEEDSFSSSFEDDEDCDACSPTAVFPPSCAPRFAASRPLFEQGWPYEEVGSLFGTSSKGERRKKFWLSASAARPLAVSSSSPLLPAFAASSRADLPAGEERGAYASRKVSRGSFGLSTSSSFASKSESLARRSVISSSACRRGHAQCSASEYAPTRAGARRHWKRGRTAAGGEGSEACGGNFSHFAMTEKLRQEAQLRACLDKAVLLFNQHGLEAALAALEEKGFLETTDTDAIAHFLFETPGLDKQKVGAVLGDPSPFNAAILRTFSSLFDVQGLSLDVALRLVFSRFIPPGESQQLYRVLYPLAEVYVQQNPEQRIDAETAHFLAYAILVLHTDRHNSNVKKKITKEEWRRMTRGRGEADTSVLTDKMLDAIYDRVVAEQFKLHISDTDRVYRRLSRDPRVLRYAAGGGPAFLPVRESVRARTATGKTYSVGSFFPSPGRRVNLSVARSHSLSWHSLSRVPAEIASPRVSEHGEIAFAALSRESGATAHAGERRDEGRLPKLAACAEMPFFPVLETLPTDASPSSASAAASPTNASFAAFPLTCPSPQTGSPVNGVGAACGRRGLPQETLAQQGDARCAALEAREAETATLAVGSFPSGPPHAGESCGGQKGPSTGVPRAPAGRIMSPQAPESAQGPAALTGGVSPSPVMGSPGQPPASPGALSWSPAACLSSPASPQPPPSPASGTGSSQRGRCSGSSPSGVSSAACSPALGAAQLPLSRPRSAQALASGAGMAVLGRDPCAALRPEDAAALADSFRLKALDVLCVDAPPLSPAPGGCAPDMSLAAMETGATPAVVLGHRGSPTQPEGVVSAEAADLGANMESVSLPASVGAAAELARTSASAVSTLPTFGSMTADPASAGLCRGIFCSSPYSHAFAPLETGTVFLKLCRNGRMKQRLFSIDSERKILYWCDPKRGAATGGPRKKDARCLHLDDLLDITLGCTYTRTFKLFELSEEMEQRSFSLHFVSRSLDLVAPAEVASFSLFASSSPLAGRAYSFGGAGPSAPGGGAAPLSLWLSFFHAKIAEQQIRRELLLQREHALAQTEAAAARRRKERQVEAARRLALWRELILPYWDKCWTCEAIPQVARSAVPVFGSSASLSSRHGSWRHVPVSLRGDGALRGFSSKLSGGSSALRGYAPGGGADLDGGAWGRGLGGPPRDAGHVALSEPAARWRTADARRDGLRGCDNSAVTPAWSGGNRASRAAPGPFFAALRAWWGVGGAGAKTGAEGRGLRKGQKSGGGSPGDAPATTGPCACGAADGKAGVPACCGRHHLEVREEGSEGEREDCSTLPPFSEEACSQVLVLEYAATVGVPATAAANSTQGFPADSKAWQAGGACAPVGAETEAPAQPSDEEAPVASLEKENVAPHSQVSWASQSAGAGGARSRRGSEPCSRRGASVSHKSFFFRYLLAGRLSGRLGSEPSLWPGRNLRDSSSQLQDGGEGGKSERRKRGGDERPKPFVKDDKTFGVFSGLAWIFGRHTKEKSGSSNSRGEGSHAVSLSASSFIFRKLSPTLQREASQTSGPASSGCLGPTSSSPGAPCNLDEDSVAGAGGLSGDGPGAAVLGVGFFDPKGPAVGVAGPSLETGLLSPGFVVTGACGACAGVPGAPPAQGLFVRSPDETGGSAGSQPPQTLVSKGIDSLAGAELRRWSVPTVGVLWKRAVTDKASVASSFASHRSLSQRGTAGLRGETPHRGRRFWRMWLPQFFGARFTLDRGRRLETAVSSTLVDLWLQGLPGEIRGTLWGLAIGNEQRVSPGLLASFVRLSHPRRHHRSHRDSRRSRGSWGGLAPADARQAQSCSPAERHRDPPAIEASDLGADPGVENAGSGARREPCHRAVEASSREDGGKRSSRAEACRRPLSSPPADTASPQSAHPLETPRWTANSSSTLSSADSKSRQSRSAPLEVSAASSVSSAPPPSTGKRGAPGQTQPASPCGDPCAAWETEPCYGHFAPAASAYTGPGVWYLADKQVGEGPKLLISCQFEASVDAAGAGEGCAGEDEDDPAAVAAEANATRSRACGGGDSSRAAVTSSFPPTPRATKAIPGGLRSARGDPSGSLEEGEAHGGGDGVARAGGEAADPTSSGAGAAALADRDQETRPRSDLQREGEDGGEKCGAASDAPVGEELRRRDEKARRSERAEENGAEGPESRGGGYARSGEGQRSRVRAQISSRRRARLVAPEDALTIGEGVERLLQAYALYRPDVGVVRGMDCLASVLLCYMGLPAAFTAFVNLLPSLHLLDFYAPALHANRRSIAFKFEFFEAVLRCRLPPLYHHLRGLQVQPDLYLLQWFETLFAHALPFHTLCVAWDAILLLGEGFTFQVALGLLKYYEAELLANSFEGCLVILSRKARPDDDETGVFDRERFFRCVEMCPVDRQQYSQWLASQRVNEEKAELLHACAFGSA